jgi:hypothetical protein
VYLGVGVPAGVWSGQSLPDSWVGVDGGLAVGCGG